MYGLNSPYLQILKEMVSAVAGHAISSPADCSDVKEKIVVKTEHHISDVTIKRMYGFLPSKFFPSLYTLDILSNYCGYESWKNFCDVQAKELNT